MTKADFEFYRTELENESMEVFNYEELAILIKVQFGVECTPEELKELDET